jgi:hypothetical protein
MSIMTAGESAALAWAEAEQEVKQCEKTLTEAKTELERAIGRKERAATMLADCVGPNIPTKVFTIEADAIIVEHAKGVRRIKIEQPER